jgi:hypothetical protein
MCKKLYSRSEGDVILLHSYKNEKIAFEQDHPAPDRKLSANLYDVYQCRVYSE